MMRNNRQSEFDVSRIRPSLGGLPHLETFTWKTSAERVTRSDRPGYPPWRVPHLPCKRDQIKIREYMEGRVMEGTFFIGGGGGGGGPGYFRIFCEKSRGPPTSWNALMHDPSEIPRQKHDPPPPPTYPRQK